MSFHICTWTDKIGISKKNTLTSFGHYRIVIHPKSYTCPCLAIWSSGPAGLITTQSKIGLLCQKFHILNNKFQNVINVLTRITSYLPPFNFCILVAQILNMFSLYPELSWNFIDISISLLKYDPFIYRLYMAPPLPPRTPSQITQTSWCTISGNLILLKVCPYEPPRPSWKSYRLYNLS